MKSVVFVDFINKLDFSDMMFLLFFLKERCDEAKLLKKNCIEQKQPS